MNLYLRLLWTLSRAWRGAALPIDAPLERTFRVLPTDLDINGHMNNGRYLTVIDLMLIEFFVRTGFARVLWQQGWRPMSGGAIITYRRGLKPFQRYTVRFRWTAQDLHWNFMAFEFVDQKGNLHAAGYMKGAAVGPNGLIPNARSRDLFRQTMPAHPLPDAVIHWLAAEAAVVAATKPLPAVAENRA
jgi:acyl-CoA thioesterase FadM